MPLELLTDRRVENAKPSPDQERLELRDTKIRGLELRVGQKEGSKTWALLYTRQSDGKVRRATIGPYPEIGLAEARRRALGLKVQVEAGTDPADGIKQQKDAPTFQELSDEWIEVHGKPNKSPRSLADNISMLNRHVLPVIGAKKAQAVTKTEKDTISGFENLTGSDFNDTLTGNAGANVLNGGAGDDRLTGSGGADGQTGGGGADTFVLKALSDSTNAARDSILDFNAGEGDRIDLSAIDAIVGGKNNAFTFIGDSAFSGVAGQLNATLLSPNHYLVQGDVNGDGLADFGLLVDSAAILTASAFIL